MESKFQGWEKDFAEFCACGPECECVPSAVTEPVRACVCKDLRPGPLRVFAKLAAVHALVGSLTLLLCPQFGLALTSSHGLMALLVRYGETACTLGCGALFLSLSLLVASLVLRPEEVRELKERRLPQLTGLAGLSLAAFVCLGAPVMATLGLAWAAGAILGGALSLELGWAWRKHAVTRSAA